MVIYLFINLTIICFFLPISDAVLQFATASLKIYRWSLEVLVDDFNIYLFKFIKMNKANKML